MPVEAADAVSGTPLKAGVDEGVVERVVEAASVEDAEDGRPDEIDVSELGLAVNWSVDEAFSGADSMLDTRLLCSWRSPLLKGSVADSKWTRRLLWSWRSPLLKGSSCCSKWLPAARLGSSEPGVSIGSPDVEVCP